MEIEWRTCSVLLYLLGYTAISDFFVVLRIHMHHELLSFSNLTNLLIQAECWVLVSTRDDKVVELMIYIVFSIFFRKSSEELFIFSLLNLERTFILIGASSQHYISSLTFSVYSIKFTDNHFHLSFLFFCCQHLYLRLFITFTSTHSFVCLKKVSDAY